MCSESNHPKNSTCIGSRGSHLALWKANDILCGRLDAGNCVELKFIPTTGHRLRLLLGVLLCIVLSSAVELSLSAQTGPSTAPGLDALSQPSAGIGSPLIQPTLSPGVLLLLELDGRFGQAVASGGGKAFATWFADDAVTLNNGRPAVLGRAAIAAQAQWDPKTYQLVWIPQGAQMGPSNDMGFTWGHYEGRSKDKNGQPVVISGRYFTVWKKVADGSWKVAMDASADEPAATGECCTLPKP